MKTFGRALKTSQDCNEQTNFVTSVSQDLEACTMFAIFTVYIQTHHLTFGFTQMVTDDDVE